MWVAQVSPLRPGIALLVAALLALPLTACRPHDFPQYPPNYREYAYVTNGGSGTVSVYDVVNVRLDREIPVGQNPIAVAASPTRNEVYVVNAGPPAGQGSVAVINAENNSVAATIPVHRHPVAIALDPGGELAYVVNSGSNSISVLDLKNRREIAHDRRRRRSRRSARCARWQNPRRCQPRGKLRQHHRYQPRARSAPSSKAARAPAMLLSCPTHPRLSQPALADIRSWPSQLAHEARSDGRPATTDRLESLLDVGRAPVSWR